MSWFPLAADVKLPAPMQTIPSTGSPQGVEASPVPSSVTLVAPSLPNDVESNIVVASSDTNVVASSGTNVIASSDTNVVSCAVDASPYGETSLSVGPVPVVPVSGESPNASSMSSDAGSGSKHPPNRSTTLAQESRRNVMGAR